MVNAIAGSTSHRAHLRGIDFHWLEWGDAASPPMVLLHGLTGHAHTWDHMATDLAARYRLFVPDQRGHGDTSAAETYATSDFVEDLEALRSHWGIDRFVLMGLSMGGHNSMAYAAAYPDRVRRLIVVDMVPQFDRRKAPNWEQISRLADEGHKLYASVDAAFADARLGNQTAPDANLRYRTELNLNEVTGGYRLKYDPRAPARWDPADLTEQLASIRVPVLLVRGGVSLVLPQIVAERVAALFPDGRLVEIAESGHSVPTDRPATLTPVVLGWLAEHS